MKRGDVSFTFLHRVEEVEQNIEDGRWQSALALALTLPDICGGIAFPEVVKRYRDGRVMLDRQKNPTRDVGGQYIRWFDDYAGEHFKLDPGDETPYICGERCWQLRCEYLHQNKGFLNDEAESGVRFHLGVNCGTSVCQMDPAELRADGMDIRIDIEQFCLRMCRAAREYYEAAHRQKDFSLYNTPVLDFVQATREGAEDPEILLLCQNETYARGIVQTLRPLSERVLPFSAPDRARKHLGKRKPDLWILVGDWTAQPDRPWRADQKTPVLLLAKGPEDRMEERSGKSARLPMPVAPDVLRETVRELLV